MRNNQASFFEVTFAIWYSTEILFNTTLKSIGGIPAPLLNEAIAWAIWGMLMVQILFLQKYSFRELVIIVVATIPIIAAVALSGNKVIMSAWMFVVAAKEIEFDRIIRIAYTILLVLIPLVILLYATQVIPDYILYRGGFLRHSLGFSHPNQLGLRVFQLVLCHFYIRRDNIGIKNILMAALLVFFVYRIPNSKTSFICIFVFLVLVLLQMSLKARKASSVKRYAPVLMIGYILFNIGSVFLSVIGTSQYTGLGKLDRFLSIRFSACHMVIDYFGISLLGQQVFVNADERAAAGISRSLWLDNAYVSILVRYGIVVYMMFSAFYFFCMYYFYKKNNHIMVIIMFVFSLYGIMEIGLYQLTHNIFLLSMAYVLYQRNLVQKATESRRRFRIKFHLHSRDFASVLRE